jgi:hypothetical protein
MNGEMNEEVKLNYGAHGARVGNVSADARKSSQS